MFKDLTRRLYGNSVVLANLPGQRGVPYLPEERVWDLRDSRLKRIVRYATQTVPYYQALLQTGKIDPDSIRSVTELDNLPLIDKRIVLEQPDAFISTSRQGRQSVPFSTSGSTGRRMIVRHDRHSLLANIAFGEREREVTAALCGGRGADRELYLGYDDSTITKVWDFYRDWTFIPTRRQRIFLTISRSLESIADGINQFQPDVIVGYGSYLEVFFKICASRAISVYCPRALIYGGESMTPAGKRFIEETFGIPVVSHYNAVECFKIGFFCEERSNFHLHEDLCHVRVVDEHGNSVPAGDRGELVISNLVNYGSVLLNYRLGDLGALMRQKCACGRTLLLLSHLEGRKEDILFLPSGQLVHPRIIWGVFKSRPAVLQYQLIQREPDHFELTIVTADSFTYRRLIHGILADLKGLLGTTAAIEPSFSPDLLPSEAGKFRPVVSLCRPQSFG